MGLTNLDHAHSQDELLRQAENDMQLNSFFISSVVDKAILKFHSQVIEDIDEKNLSASLAIRPFRQYLTVRLLSDILQSA